MSTKRKTLGKESEAPPALPSDVPKCVACGATEGLEFTADPYQSEICGDDTPDWYCQHCLYESARDI